MSAELRKKQGGLTEGPIGPVLFRMTLAMLFGTISIILFNTVDTYFISLLGTRELAAISFTFPVSFTVISLSIGLGIGTSAVVAKTLGAGNYDKVGSLTTEILLLCVIISVVVAATGYHTIDWVFISLGANEDVLPLIREYMEIWYIGVTFIIVPMISNSIFRASGDTTTPSILMALAALLNGIFDPLLIFGIGPFPKLDIRGAAYATLISWSLSFFGTLWLLRYRKKLLVFILPPFKQLWQSWKVVLRIGVPAAFSNMLTPIAAAILTAIVAGYGKESVAAFGVGSRLESLSLLVILTMSMTLPPFISQNFGAGKLDRVKKAIKLSFIFTMFWQLLVYGLLVLFSKSIAKIFSDEADVIEIIEMFIWITPLAYGCQGIIFLSASSLNALHQPMRATILSVARLFVFYVPIAYVGSLLYGVKGLFIGMALANCLAGCFSLFWVNRAVKNLSIESMGSE